MKNDMDELDQFISYLQFERYYSKKTISSYATDLHEAKKFWQENGGLPASVKQDKCRVCIRFTVF